MLNKFIPTLMMMALAPLTVLAQEQVAVEPVQPTPPPADLAANISAEKRAEYCKIFGALFLTNIGLGEAGLSEADQAAFVSGVAAALKDPEVVKGYTDFIKANDAEFSMFLGSLQQKVQAKALEKQAAEEAKLAEQNRAAGTAYIEKCLKDPSFKQLKGGTLIKVIDAGDAKVPVKPTSQLTVRYTGTFVNGEIFDSSDRDEATGEPHHFAPNSKPTEFPGALSMLIPGWVEALTTVGKGAKVMLVIPPEQAYGDNGPLPPASTLVFDVEVVDVKDIPAPEPAPELAPEPALEAAPAVK